LLKGGIAIPVFSKVQHTLHRFDILFEAFIESDMLLNTLLQAYFRHPFDIMDKKWDFLYY